MRTTKRPPGTARRGPSAKALGIASAASVVGAAAILTLATTMVVHGEEEAAEAAAQAVISDDSTSTDAPEATAKAKTAAEVEAPAVLGLARDPLSNDEVAYARSLASLDPLFTAASETPMYLSTVVSEPEAYEDGARRFESTYYSYGSNELLRFIVNLTTGTVEVADSATGVQPPPSDAEVTNAFELLLADPLSAGIKRAFLDLEGAELSSPDQTLYNGSSFVSTPGTIGAESCGVDRCVMILAQASSGEYLPTTSVVVNLSQHSVLEIK